jgi:protocatechuate 3,4-dioxygenase beta subunit
MSDYHDLGLSADLQMWLRNPIERRQALMMGFVGVGTLLSSCSVAQDTGAACLTAIPEETAGPFPGDGSQGSQYNLLDDSGIVRTDIRSSLGTGNVAEGTLLTVQLQLVNSNGECAPLAGYAVYLWHCDREGRYSMYSNGVTQEDYLRGVQEADSQGMVTFTSVFPGCYDGRWPHIHFEIYPSLAVATNAANKIHTSQLAFPEATCREVYSSDASYSQSVSNLSRVSLETDGVFRDGVDQQLATLSGNSTNGYLATLVVGVPA